MFFEFSNDLVPILLSVSLYLTVFAAHVMNTMAKEYVIQHRYKTNRDLQSSLMLTVGQDQSTEQLEHRQNFITRIVKRKEAPEDDADYQFSSMKHSYYEIIRGGQQWRKTNNNLYSHSLNVMGYSY